MKSVTLLFPGQGSQYVGMGENLQSTDMCKNVFNTADIALGFSISDICADGPEEKLKSTEFTQPAIVTHSIALYEQLKNILAKKEIKIDRVLGHSVGEYSALVAAGAIRFEDAVKAVNLRGKYMQEAVPAGLGKMFAILRVPADIVIKACESVSTTDEKVMCANFNDPTQIVISGHANAADKAVLWLKENYAGKQMAKELPVSAPFHSSLMAPAKEKLTHFLNTIEFKNNDTPYIANIDAKEYSTDGETIKQNLIEQVCGSVLWSQSIATLPDETICIEVGPGKVLSGLNKRINKTFKTYTLDSKDSFAGLEEFFA
ncbi:MAG: ACP S-malonyltransferase [Halobacteriovoraceae bacterium]|jgi:[acyl-carrier-protein] S-malonyltransferase|nr:ACP S-malonyltransferase [Halobacteriovoraceae bacterium]